LKIYVRHERLRLRGMESEYSIPDKISPKKMLRFYSGPVLSTVEINNTFLSHAQRECPSSLGRNRSLKILFSRAQGASDHKQHIEQVNKRLAMRPNISSARCHPLVPKTGAGSFPASQEFSMQTALLLESFLALIPGNMSCAFEFP